MKMGSERDTFFKGCPLPKHQGGSSERNAKITMLYFHPWTLQDAGSDEHVPRLENLKETAETWDAALRYWLDGRIISQESKRYVSNFISMHRLRPGDHDDAKNLNRNPTTIIRVYLLYIYIYV